MPGDRATISVLEMAMEETANILFSTMLHDVTEKFRECNWSYQAKEPKTGVTTERLYSWQER
jgi:hypothetical protein